MNVLLIYLVKKDDVVVRREVTQENLEEKDTLQEFKNYLALNCKKFKYFDDEGELISLTNDEDFYIFRELVFKKHFANSQVVLITHDDILDKRKYGRLEKVLNLKVEDEVLNSFVHVKSVSSAPNSGSLKNEADSDSVTSSSSSSIAVPKRISNSKRNKKYKSIPRYAAELKKEINYLSGSEVYDGQTILKRWRIKNVGSKKWKENSVKVVLLPSDYSSWVSCSSISVPICFADQKVEVEMEICIRGIWDTDITCDEGDCREINLTWLLFKNSIFTKSASNFKDYILTCLQLCIKVKKRIHSTELESCMTDNPLKKHLSESSIERVDQDFSIVNMSEEEKNELEERHENALTVSEIENKLMRNDSEIENKLMRNDFEIENNQVQNESEIVNNRGRNESEVLELELPDCPHGGDFQIADFHQPENIIISVEPEKKIKTDIKFDNSSGLAIFNESNYVGKVKSTLEESVTIESIEDSIAQTLQGLKVSHGNFERVQENIEEETTITTQISTKSKEDPENTKSILINTGDIEHPLMTYDHNEDNKHYTANESSEVEEFNECKEEIITVEDGRNENEENTKESIMKTITDDTKEGDVTLEIKDVHYDDNASKVETITTNTFVTEQPINNVVNPFPDYGTTSRQRPIETIRNDFSKINPVPMLPYIPGNPCVNQPTSYVAGIGHIGNMVYQPILQSPGNVYGNVPPTQYQPGRIYPNLNIYSHMPGSQVQIKNQSSDKMIQDLRPRHHHDHMEERSTMQRVENSPFVDTTNCLDILRGMGFTDEDKNRRLLAKFKNNIDDVINDLID